MILGAPLGDPGLREYGQVKVFGWSGGLVNSYQHHPADCQTAKSKDTRLQSTKLEQYRTGNCMLHVEKLFLAAWWPLTRRGRRISKPR